MMSTSRQPPVSPIVTSLTSEPSPQTYTPTRPGFESTPSALGSPAHQGIDTPFAADARNPFEVGQLEKALKKQNGRYMGMMLDQAPGSKVALWSTGNVRIDNKDLRIHCDDAIILYKMMKDEPKLSLIDVKYFDPDRHDWKASFLLGA